MSYGLALCEDDQSRWEWLLKKADHEPTTIALASLAVSAIGAGVSAFGQMQQGKTANKIAQRNAEIERRNAKIAKDNARFNADLRKKRGRDERGSTISSLGSQGVQVFDGDNFGLLAEQDFVTDLEAQVIERGGQIDSDNLNARATITSAQGTAAESAGKFGAGTTLLTTAGSAGLGFAQFKAQG